MRARLAAAERERGIALVTIVLVGAFLTLLSVTLIGTITTEGSRSTSGMRRSAGFQSAEAGVSEYVAKLTEDKQYYLNQVHPGESTRRAPDGTTRRAGQSWGLGATWTYPTGKDAWRAMPNGYEYNVQVFPPASGSGPVRIVSTGRRAGSATESRAIESIVRPATVADFQSIFMRDVVYGAAATTYGKLYAGIDENGVAHDVRHDGTAYADIYAEDQALGATRMMNGARKYDRTNIRTVIKNPINFSSFTISLVEIQQASQAGGLYFNNPAVHGWRFTFQPGGTVQVQSCTRNGGQHLAARTPVCGSPSTYTVPANGAIYTGQSAIVSGQVNGRVTIAANADVVIANNISYVQSGDDVLGLIAKNEVIVALWVPTNLTWRAATIAQTGMWRSWGSGGTHGTMTFNGSDASMLGGYMSQFRTRNYLYDNYLLNLAPPWYPVLEDAYTVLLFREVVP